MSMSAAEFLKFVDGCRCTVEPIDKGPKKGWWRISIPGRGQPFTNQSVLECAMIAQEDYSRRVAKNGGQPATAKPRPGRPTKAKAAAKPVTADAGN
jgi:hypothetical protein